MLNIESAFFSIEILVINMTILNFSSLYSKFEILSLELISVVNGKKLTEKKG
jgi:hypothetical protein